MKPVIFLAFANDNATPRNYLPRLHQEYEAVYNTLRPFHQRNEIELYRVKGISTEALFQDVLDFRQRVAIFHYGGHASGTHLQLEDRQLQPQLAYGKGLADLLALEPHLQLVFLNGCSTAGQVAELLNAGIKAVIATNTMINDLLAAQFAEYFYKALAGYKTIGEAFQAARAFVTAADQNLDITGHRDLHWINQQAAQEVIPWGLYLRPGAETVLSRRLTDLDPAVNIRTLAGTMNTGDFSDLYGQENELTILAVTADMATMQSIDHPMINDTLLVQKYGKTAREWRPYQSGGTLEELMQEYHRESGFRLNVLVVDKGMIKNSSVLKKYRAQTLLIADLLSLYLNENQSIAKLFDDPDIGGCLVPVCATLPDPLREAMLQMRQQTFADLHDYYLNFKEECVYIELHIPTREDLFRRLTNVAILHLKKAPQHLSLSSYYEKYKAIGKLNAEFKKQ